MVLLISSNFNGIESNFFSISSNTFIAWYYFGTDGDFAFASGFPADNLFCNIWIKSYYVLSAGSSTRSVSRDQYFEYALDWDRYYFFL